MHLILKHVLKDNNARYQCMLTCQKFAHLSTMRDFFDIPCTAMQPRWPHGRRLCMDDAFVWTTPLYGRRLCMGGALIRL